MRTIGLVIIGLSLAERRAGETSAITSIRTHSASRETIEHSIQESHSRLTIGPADQATVVKRGENDD